MPYTYRTNYDGTHDVFKDGAFVINLPTNAQPDAFTRLMNKPFDLTNESNLD